MNSTHSQTLFVSSTADRECARDLKEKNCFVALDFEKEKAEANSPSYPQKCQLPDGQEIDLGRERFFCPESRYPSRWCSRRPLLSAPARPVTPCSLSSTLSTPSFPLLCGSLGGIFGLEGGEPDPASDWRTPCRGGDGREMENGRDARSGQGEDAAGEEGARRSLAS